MIRVVLVAFISLISFLSLCFGQLPMNQAIALNGIDQYIRIPHAIYQPDAGTVELWFKSTGEGQGRNPLIGGNGGQHSRMPGLFLDRGDLFWEFGEKESQPSLQDIEPHRWYHIALTYEKIGQTYQVILWLNGMSISKSTDIQFGGQWLQEIHLGHYLGGPIDYFKGEIDEVRIWTQAKNQAEIRAGMCQFAQAEDSTLLLNLKFEEEEGLIAKDASGHVEAELKRMSGEERPVSGAAVGDASAYLYPIEQDWQGKDLRLITSGEEHMELSNIHSQGQGIHLYRIGEAGIQDNLPEGYTQTLASGVYRIFVVGDDKSTFTLKLSHELALDRRIDNGLRLLEAENEKRDWRHSGAYFNRNQQSLTQFEGDAHMSYAIGRRKDAITDQPGSGSAVWFDGVNDHIISSLALSSHAVFPLTFECWFQATRVGHTQTLMELGHESSLKIGINPDGSLFVNHNQPDQTALGKIETNTWYHLAYVHEMGTDEGFLYLNGNLIGTVPVGVGDAKAAEIRFGGSYQDQGEAYMGYLDEVRLWSGYTYQDTIRQWMVRKVQPDHPNYQNLLLHYACDEDKGSVLLEDKAGPWDGRMLGMHAEQSRLGSQVPLGDDALMMDMQQEPAGRLALRHPDGDQLIVSELRGSTLPDYIYLYRVDQRSKVEDGYFLSQWSDQRYWGVHMVGGSENVKYSVEFVYAGYPSISSEAGLTLASRNFPGAPVWYNTFAALDMHKDLISLEKTGNLELVLGEGFPFHVIWEEVSADRTSHAVEVEWLTSREEGISEYVVERSVDGAIFSAIAAVSPDSARYGRYQYADSTALHSAHHQWYYRIKQVDVQGNFSYSEVVEVEGNPTSPILLLSPNPASKQVSVLLPAGRERMGTLRLLDMQGSILHERLVSPRIGQESILLEKYPFGHYLIQFRSDDQVWSEMLRKN